PYADDASPTAESPGYIADSESMEEDSIDYPDEPEDDDEDPEEDDEEDPSEEHEPEDKDTKEEEPSEGSDKTEPFEEDETAALIDAFAAGSPPFLLLPTSPAYDQAPLGHRAAMICMRDDIPEEDMPPRRRFVLTAPPPGCDVAEISAAAARPPRAAVRAEDVSYVRALQVRRRESEDFYTQLHDAQTDRRDIRLEIDVVRGHRTAYETELHKVRQAYLSSEAQNRALLVRLETLKTHMSRMEWQRQSAKDRVVRQMMRTHVLEARARIDMVEDTSSSC
ncbi:hypothetical protein Tco_0913047, partial [Tanacetum coccineum]